MKLEVRIDLSELIDEVLKDDAMRFWLFIADEYYPLGGMNDLHSRHDTLELALGAFHQYTTNDYKQRNLDADETAMCYKSKIAHIVDIENSEIVWRIEDDPDIQKLISDYYQRINHERRRKQEQIKERQLAKRNKNWVDQKKAGQFDNITER